ncbi:MAG: hypothetical protein B7Z72_04870 [Gemmatimonadetes bacterium 21-71-4]|nr:MAG: hypothetical protein B7Z72_04870 [Gemmatimonadetes bacterium 21-71-4]
MRHAAFIPALALASLAVAAPVCAQSPADGPQLIAAMHDRYAGTWYRTLTFAQKSTWFAPDGAEARVQTWHEAASIPGKLRIDMGEAAARDGMLYAGDSTYMFKGGKLTGAAAERNPLLILGFDVYRQDPTRTADVLGHEGIDLAKFHRDTFQGRPVYVVGAARGDTASKQFWVDAERLLFVRLIQPNPRGTATQDIRFDRYVSRPGGWLAEQVQVWSNGKLVYQEDYTNVRVNDSLDPQLWSPAAWAAVPLWWK